MVWPGSWSGHSVKRVAEMMEPVNYNTVYFKLNEPYVMLSQGRLNDKLPHLVFFSKIAGLLSAYRKQTQKCIVDAVVTCNVILLKVLLDITHKYNF